MERLHSNRGGSIYRDVDKGLVRSVTWYKDNMAYFLFFQVPVKASEADFYRNHVVPLKDIDPSRTDLIGVKTH